MFVRAPVSRAAWRAKKSGQLFTPSYVIILDSSSPYSIFTRCSVSCLFHVNGRLAFTRWFLNGNSSSSYKKVRIEFEKKKEEIASAFCVWSAKRPATTIRGGSWCWSRCNTHGKRKKRQKKGEKGRRSRRHWTMMSSFSLGVSSSSFFCSSLRLFFFFSFRVSFIIIILSVTIGPDQGGLCAIESFRLLLRSVPQWRAALTARPIASFYLARLTNRLCLVKGRL